MEAEIVLLQIGFVFALLIVLWGGLMHYLLNKTPVVPQTGTHTPTQESEVAGEIFPSSKSLAQKIIAISYLGGGLFGVIIILFQLNGASIGLLSVSAYIILLIQIFAALYGGWQFWNNRAIGAQLLYWLSWSCVPVISSSLITYWCGIGLAFFINVASGPGNVSTNFRFNLCYESLLWFHSANTDILLGVNVVALLFMIKLAKFMKDAGIQKWPLVIHF